MLRDKRHGFCGVKLSCEKGTVRLKDGWEKFCEDHGLEVGDFLVFKYEGNLIFDVIIFDPSTSERKFSQTPIASSEFIPSIDGKGVAKIEHISKGGLVSKVAFKPKGFPYCHTSVKPYNIKWGGMAFQRHLRGNEKYVMLRDKRHGICGVKLSCEKGKMYLKNGWEKFCEDHGLQVGDFLVFKYLGNLFFDVIIFEPSASERNYPQTSIVSNKIISCIDGKGADAKIGRKSTGGSGAKVAFKPRGLPYYHATVKPYFKKWGGMPIPVKFARKNDLTNKCCEMILIDEKEKSWRLPLKQSNTTPYIGGWGVFEHFLGFKAGDLVVFELIQSGQNPIMKLYSKFFFELSPTPYRKLISFI
ncbi:hypothetical protein KSS87_006100 [Heliosperma pusillum]|nr:hypothetical protein KSS87_006100 [Heliosperma pusillum]